MENFDVEFDSVSRPGVRGHMGDCELGGCHSVQHDILLLMASPNLNVLLLLLGKLFLK